MNLFNDIPKINGLTYIPNYITTEQEQFLITQIDAQPWLNDLKRRIQQYGYKYDYTARKITADLKIGDVPNWLKVCDVMDCDQVIVNEYQQGQGITPHIDCIPCFTDTVCSLSLLSSCEMVFEHENTNEKHTIILEPRSLLILKDEARYKWKHSIPARKSNIKERRVSVTFRKVVL
jgi:alkylated DNA repair dioxygenase AlkB